MIRSIVTPQDFSLSRRPGPWPALQIDRPPVLRLCTKCLKRETLILPCGPGQIAWQCSRCRTHNDWEFRSVTQGIAGDTIQLHLNKPPLHHQCQNCGREDWIVLPDGGGDLRWKCVCGNVWLIRFRPPTATNPQGSGILLRVMEGGRLVRPPGSEKTEGGEE